MAATNVSSCAIVTGLAAGARGNRHRPPQQPGRRESRVRSRISRSSTPISSYHQHPAARHGDERDRHEEFVRDGSSTAPARDDP